MSKSRKGLILSDKTVRQQHQLHHYRTHQSDIRIPHSRPLKSRAAW